MPKKKESTVDPMDIPSYMVTGIYLGKLAISLVGFLFLNYFWGRYMLMDWTQFKGHGLVLSGVERVWPFFVWGGGVTLLAALVGNRYVSSDPKPVQTTKALWLSLNAGVFEELIFRVLMFLNAMVLLVFTNFITFGLVKWLYMHWFIPLANWATFHALQPQLMGHHAVSWVFGAAIISAASAFRDAHKHLGLIGWVNAWFAGMLLFWLLFNYGLLTAIAVHFVYDAIIFTLRAVTSKKPGPLAQLAAAMFKQVFGQ